MENIIKAGEYKVTISFTLEGDTSEGVLDSIFKDAMYNNFSDISSSDIGKYVPVEKESLYIPISLDEFKNIKKGDCFIGCINGAYEQEVACEDAFYNADCDSPDWEVESEGGVYCWDSVYKESGAVNRIQYELEFDVINCDDEIISKKYEQIQDFLAEMESENGDGPMADDEVKNIIYLGKTDKYV